MSDNLQPIQPQRVIPPTEIVRADNCAATLGFSAACPNCHQLHLRPGYCQALDPVSPGFTGSKAIQSAARSKLRAGFEKVHGPVVTDRPAHVTDKAQAVTDVTASAEPVTASGTFECEQCGDPFQSSRADARYCSPACRVKAHRAKA